MKHIIKLLVLCALSLGLLQCEGDDRFYRPRVPKKLSVLAIIDADENTRHILFEKTVQVEYPEDLTDSLRDLSFTISDTRGVVYSFQADSVLENQFLFLLPDSIEFVTGERYFLRAKERDCPEISAECIVPEPPSGLKLLSAEMERVTNYVKPKCHQDNAPDPRLDVISISFDNNNSGNSYYAILIESYGTIPAGHWHNFHSGKFYARFSVRESDAPGFISTFPGLNSYIMDPCDAYGLIEKPAPALYIDGSKVSGGSLRISFANQFVDGISVPSTPHTYRIRLLTVPEEMHRFKQNLYTYERNLDDPFSEPVYLKGNIEGGYGLFSICRSIEHNIERRIW